jgi:hypothetical protein
MMIDFDKKSVICDGITINDLSWSQNSDMIYGKMITRNYEDYEEYIFRITKQDVNDAIIKINN